MDQNISESPKYFSFLEDFFDIAYDNNVILI